MSRKARKRQDHRTSAERQLEAIYAEIPNIPDCTGACAAACGPIAMFKGEWDRVKRSFGREPKVTNPLRCPMLSPTGKCMVYTVRPYICRLWGATEGLMCPDGCKPDRVLTRAEAQDIFNRIGAIAGPEVTGPLGGVNDLWGAIALEQRENRLELIERIRKAVEDDGDSEARSGRGEVPPGSEPGGASPEKHDGRGGGGPPGSPPRPAAL